MAQEIADSKLIDTWGSSGTKIEPDITKIIEGWQLGEQPPHEYMNWLQNTFGSKLNHILKNGVAEWNNETEYLAGASVQHNGIIWLCETTNTNSEPTDLNANWEKVAINKDLTVTVDTLADLRSISYPANTVWVSGYHAKNDGAFGSHIFRLKGVKTTETDNGGTVIIATIGGVDYVYELLLDRNYYYPEEFGAKGDWDGANGTDDSAVFNYLVTNNYNIKLKSKYYIATQIGNTTEMYIDGVKGTGLYTDQDISLLSIKGATKLFQFEIKNIGSSTKKAITTSLTGLQLAHAQFENLTISGFKIAQYTRYSLWSSWKNIRITGCVAGLIFSGNDIESSFWDVRPSWNSGSNGFFHNQNSLDNILVEGGELGIFYCGTAAVFDNITTQGQGTKNTANIVLPIGLYGTGIWTAGNSAYQTMLNVNAFYAEGTQNPVRTIRSRLKFGAFFVQGGAIGDKFKAVIINDSSRVEVTNSWGQDYFENLIEFSNTYSTPIVLGIISASTTPANKTTGVGYYNIEKNHKKYRHFINHVNGTPSGTTYTLSDIDPQINEVYKVSVVGIFDGSSHRTAEYILFSGTTGGLKSVTTVVAGVNFTVTQNGFKPMITVNTTLGLQLTVYTEKVGAENYSPASTIIVA